MSTPKKICILGMGYIGMPTAAMFAKCGYEIIGVDPNPDVVNNLNCGKIVIEEPGLPELIAEGVAGGKIRASFTPEAADVFIIAVGTPINADKTANMSAVCAATESIVPFLKKGNIVILESTSPPGTVEKLMVPILGKSGLDPKNDLFIAHSPERVIPGKILVELVENNRIVGGFTPEAARKVNELYSSFVNGEIFMTDATTAETCKLMENTFRDVNIALANELAKICEQIGVNAWEVISLSNKHPRVNLHQPGPGVGGHCIAVDPWFIVEKAPEAAQIIELSRKTNDSMPVFTIQKVSELLGGNLYGKKAAVLGATFKPDTDDTRESPIEHIVAGLRASGMTVAVHDPHVVSCEICSLMDAVLDADILILGVHHREFSVLDFSEIKNAMKTPIIFDTRNFWSDKNLSGMGFTYRVLGDGRK